jgi:hypothetical protein
MSKIGHAELRVVLPSMQVSAVSDVPTGSSSRPPMPKSVLWALQRFLLVTDSNMIRTCVQGFTALHGAGKPLTCDDGNLRVQERRSAAERGMIMDVSLRFPTASGARHRHPGQSRPQPPTAPVLSPQPPTRRQPAGLCVCRELRP